MQMTRNSSMAQGRQPIEKPAESSVKADEVRVTGFKLRWIALRWIVSGGRAVLVMPAAPQPRVESSTWHGVFPTRAGKFRRSRYRSRTPEVAVGFHDICCG